MLVLTDRFQTNLDGAMRWSFGFFFVSGFCSILYELVWLRLTMAQIRPPSLPSPTLFGNLSPTFESSGRSKDGYHFLASQSPLPSYSAAALASHLPSSAAADLIEWGPAPNAEGQFAGVLRQELSLDSLIARAPGVPALQDDRPVNEYFIMRRLHDPEYRRRMWHRFLARVGMKP